MELTSTSSEQIQFDNNIIKNELCPLLWTHEGELHDEVHTKLLDLCQRFYKFLGIEVLPEDYLFTGSLCNFNYNEDSDIDLHILIDFAKIGAPDFVRKMFSASKYAFNSYREGTRIKGYRIEVHCQDISLREPHDPSGLYSLNTGWIIKPQRIDPNIDEVKIRELLSIFIGAIERLGFIEDNQERLEKAIELKNNIVLIRRKSVRALGEYSPGNVFYKVLRRQLYLDELFSIIRKAMDKKLSLEQRTSHQENLLTEGATDKEISELVKKELELLMKKQFSTRPILSKTEIERIASAQFKKELKDNLTEKDVREMIRQSLVRQYHWFWDKRSTWVRHV